MKKVRNILLFSFILIVCTFAFNIVYAERIDRPVQKVEIYDVEYPYAYGSVLNTTVRITDSSYSIVKDVMWNKTSSDLYRIKIVVRPFTYYYFDKNTTATVNGNNAHVYINKDENLEITYTFPTDNSIELPNSVNSVKHVISVYKPNNGTISPDVIRVSHNQDFTVQIIPDDGYQIKDVYVDGESVGAVSEYTFKKVTETHKIRAVFEPIKGYSNEITTEEIESNNNFKLLNYLVSLLKLFDN